MPEIRADALSTGPELSTADVLRAEPCLGP